MYKRQPPDCTLVSGGKGEPDAPSPGETAESADTVYDGAVKALDTLTPALDTPLLGLLIAPPPPGVADAHDDEVGVLSGDEPTGEGAKDDCAEVLPDTVLVLDCTVLGWADTEGPPAE